MTGTEGEARSVSNEPLTAIENLADHVQTLTNHIDTLETEVAKKDTTDMEGVTIV